MPIFLFGAYIVKMPFWFKAPFFGSDAGSTKLKNQELVFMKWYNNMAQQQKKHFKKIVVIVAAGIILVLLVPMVFRFIF